MPSAPAPPFPLFLPFPGSGGGNPPSDRCFHYTRNEQRETMQDERVTCDARGQVGFRPPLLARPWLLAVPSPTSPFLQTHPTTPSPFLFYSQTMSQIRKKLVIVGASIPSCLGPSSLGWAMSGRAMDRADALFLPPSSFPFSVLACRSSTGDGACGKTCLLIVFSCVSFLL